MPIPSERPEMLGDDLDDLFKQFRQRYFLPRDVFRRSARRRRSDDVAKPACTFILSDWIPNMVRVFRVLSKRRQSSHYITSPHF